MSPQMPKLPKPTTEARAAFQLLLPGDPRVSIRPMFGNISAFVNGNMFTGLFGDDLFVKLPDAELAGLKKQGGRDFEVMPGRAMTGYAFVPPGWRKDEKAARQWVSRSLAYVATLPPKQAKSKKK